MEWKYHYEMAKRSKDMSRYDYTDDDEKQSLLIWYVNGKSVYVSERDLMK